VKTASEMTYTVSDGALNSTQSNPHSLFVSNSQVKTASEMTYRLLCRVER